MKAYHNKVQRIEIILEPDDLVELSKNLKLEPQCLEMENPSQRFDCINFEITVALNDGQSPYARDV